MTIKGSFSIDQSCSTRSSAVEGAAVNGSCRWNEDKNMDELSTEMNFKENKTSMQIPDSDDDNKPAAVETEYHEKGSMV